MIEKRLIELRIMKLNFVNQIISRFVKCSDAIFELFIILKLTNAQLKKYYSLNFNINEESLMLSKEENVEHVWISNEHVTEFKNYIFKEEFNENHNYWLSIKMTKSDESIAEFSKSTEKLTSQKTSKSVSQSSQYFILNSNLNIILSKHKSNLQIDFISSQLFKIMNYQAENADHVFIRFFSIVRVTLA